jgi:WD40 repeat protein
VFTFRKHTHGLMSVAISPDSKRIASGGQDGTVLVWDATTGENTRTLSEITTVVLTVAFSPDGMRLAAIGVDNDEARPFVLRVWDDQTGQTVFTHREPQEILAFAFSPDGRWLALGMEDGTVKLADARTGQDISIVDKRHRTVLQSPAGVAFRPGGRHLASLGSEGTVVVRDVSPLYPWLPAQALCPQAAGSAPLHLAAAVQLAVWSETGRPHPVFTLGSREQPLSSVAYSPNGDRLVTASADGQLTLWEAETGNQIRTVRGPVSGEHYSGENYAVFSPDGRWVVAVSADCAVRVWDATTLKQPIKTFRGHRGPTIGSAVAVSRDGKFLVTGSDDVKVWDLTQLDRQPK